MTKTAARIIYCLKHFLAVLLVISVCTLALFAPVDISFAVVVPVSVFGVVPSYCRLSFLAVIVPVSTFGVFPSTVTFSFLVVAHCSGFRIWSCFYCRLFIPCRCSSGFHIWSCCFCLLFIPCSRSFSGFRIWSCHLLLHSHLKTKSYCIEMRAEGLSHSLCTTTAASGFTIIG